jgi:hypothetical protein
MHPVRTLPASYKPHATLDLSHDIRALIALNILGVLIFLGFGWMLLWLIPLLRPEPSLAFNVTWVDMVIMLVALFLIVVLHELVHGLFFWLFTRERPLFGFKGAYAYAAAPDWYIPRNHYLVVGLAPLVLLSLLGIALIPLVPAAALLPMLVVLSAHAGGASGDLFVVGWCLLQPASLLVRDVGDAMTLYIPGASAR